VRQMLIWLGAQPGDTVLDVGSGSGWTTALLGHIVGSGGRVFAVERVPELVEFGWGNCLVAGVKNVEFRQAGGRFGLPDRAPFDRILVSAEATELPQTLIDQLKPSGKMVVPVGNTILEVTRDPRGDLNVTSHDGFIFVPLVGA